MGDAWHVDCHRGTLRVLTPAELVGTVFGRRLASLHVGDVVLTFENQAGDRSEYDEDRLLHA